MDAAGETILANAMVVGAVLSEDDKRGKTRQEKTLLPKLRITLIYVIYIRLLRL